MNNDDKKQSGFMQEEVLTTLDDTLNSTDYLELDSEDIDSDIERNLENTSYNIMLDKSQLSDINKASRLSDMWEKFLKYKKAAMVIAVIAVLGIGYGIISKNLSYASSITQGAPVITGGSREWSNKRVISVEEKEDEEEIDYYEYCMSETRSLKNCNWTKTEKSMTAAKTGKYYVAFRAVSNNKYGKVSNIEEIWIDNDVPVISKLNVSTASGKVEVNIEAEDKDSGISAYFYKIDAGEYKKVNPKFTIDDLEINKKYSLTVKVEDKAGNSKSTTTELIVNNESSTNNNFNGNDYYSKPNNQDGLLTDNQNPSSPSGDISNKDLWAPVLELDGIPSAIALGANYDVPTTYGFDAEGGDVTCKVDGKDLSTTKDLAEGKHVIECEAVGNNGLKTSASKEVIVKYIPTISLEDLPLIIPTSKEFALPSNVTFGVDGGTVSCVSNGVEITSTKDLAEGKHLITCKALGNNDSEASVSKEISIVVVPDINLDNVPLIIEKGDSYDVPGYTSFGSGGGNATCKVDDNPITNTDALAEGKHLIKCEAVGANELVTKIEKEIEVKVTPKVSLSGVPDIILKDESHPLPSSYSFGKDGGNVTCLLGEDVITNTSELPIGANEITCKAEGNNGLSAEESKLVNVKSSYCTLTKDENDNDIADIGDEITCSTEVFYVYDWQDGYVKLLAKYNLEVGNSENSYYPAEVETILQSEKALGYKETFNPYATIIFGETNEYEGSTAQEYINKYAESLRENNINYDEVSLLTLEELEKLECNIDEGSCIKAPEFIYSTSYWTKTPDNLQDVWTVKSDGTLKTEISTNNEYFGLRPTVKISGSELKYE